MSELDDHELLAEYVNGARERAEAAFAALAERHVNLVYSAAIRCVGSPHAAQEITQAVFIILANKAGKISRHAVVSGWLYQTTRLTAANFLRGEIRRQKREQEAFMQSTLQEPADEAAWRHIAPLLDDALGKLGETDRNAIVLRFFENKNLREVGVALGASEDAAKMRVNRALEKLRKMLGRRGAVFSVTAIAGAVSANSLQAAPVGLAKTISAVAAAKGATAGTSTLALVKGMLKLMAWSQAKTVVVAGTVALLAMGATTYVGEKIHHSGLSATDPSWANDPKYWATDTAVLDRLPSGIFIFRPTHFSNNGGSVVFINHRILAKDYSVGDLVNSAYGSGWVRTVYPPDMPNERFDLLSTIPGGYADMLKAELKKRFGLTAHYEKRSREVLVLKVKNPDAPNLKRHIPGNQSPAWIGGDHQTRLTDYPLNVFWGSMESIIGQPVRDETGLSGTYDLHLDWRPKPGETDSEAYKRALAEQLGIELVPTNEWVDTLIVNRVTPEK